MTSPAAWQSRRALLETQEALEEAAVFAYTEPTTLGTLDNEPSTAARTGADSGSRPATIRRENRGHGRLTIWAVNRLEGRW